MHTDVKNKVYRKCQQIDPAFDSQGMINNSVGTHSKISITKMPRQKKRGKNKCRSPLFGISQVFFAARRFQNRILSFSVSLYIYIYI